MKRKYFKIITITGLISAEIVYGLCYTIFDWYYLVSLTICFLLALLFFIQYKIGICLLIPLISVVGNFVGVSVGMSDISSNIWSLRYAIPPYAPLYFFMIATFIVRKLADMEPILESKDPLIIPILLLFFYITLNIIITHTTYHFISWFLLCLNISIYYFIINVVKDEVFHKSLMWFWVLSGFIVSVLVIITVLIHPNIPIHQYPLTDSIDFFVKYPYWQRRGHSLGSPAYTSLILNMTSSIVLGLFIYETNRAIKILLFILLGFYIFANFLTMAKAGLVSMWIMMHFFILCSSTLRKKFLKIAAGLNFMMVVFIFLSSVFTGYASRIFGGSDKFSSYGTSIGSRFDIWKTGFAAMEKKSLILPGLGLGGYDYYTIYPHPHNIYLSFFFDFGIIGAVCIVLIMLVLFKEFILNESKRILLSQNNYYEIMSLAFLSGMIAVGLHGIMEYSYGHTILWLFLGFAISTLHLSRLEKNKNKINNRIP